ncbi:beta-ketoacyl-ACP synthase III [Pleionea sp. CnH1-48]|uniref:beta-ketoacyl-ACP synthase III n=1 Tax=Pleionea sp. CnH1-48 TaxID=2954494 RepID=UPI002096DC8E|nr:beta-ketoacyl-ACP synthase III [Pleionea sp. CnH1-48]MCO7225865.1 ketoacyl-ACP synthase III [Pleionea sp. CnH1-48]
MYSRIVGTGSYLPEKVLTNKELESMVETSHEWIVERTGIHQRHIAAEDESASVLGAKAAERAIEAAGIDKNEIDMIIVATATSDRLFPSTACFVGKKLGLEGVAAFDVTAACAGFVYGMSIADQYIRTGNKKNILVIGTEVLSRILDWEDRTTCVLFGDGAGAVVMSASEEQGIMSTHVHADGSYVDLLYSPNIIRGQEEGCVRPKVFMKGNEVFKVAVRTLSSIVDETLTANNMTREDIDWLIPHQANIRIIQATAKKLQMPMEQVMVTVNEHGNTSSASIPLALDKAVRAGTIKRGETLLLETFGGGFAWASALLKL